MITVYIARFGHDEVEVEVMPGTTVAQVFQMSGIDLTGREQAYVDGVPAQPSSIVEDGDVVSIVTPKQAGAL